MFVVGIAIEPVLNRFHGTFIVAAEYPVPNDELGAIVLVDVTVMGGVVDPVEARRDKDISADPSIGPSEIRMDQHVLNDIPCGVSSQWGQARRPKEGGGNADKDHAQ